MEWAVDLLIGREKGDLIADTSFLQAPKRESEKPIRPKTKKKVSCAEIAN